MRPEICPVWAGVHTNNIQTTTWLYVLGYYIQIYQNIIHNNINSCTYGTWWDMLEDGRCCLQTFDVRQTLQTSQTCMTSSLHHSRRSHLDRRTTAFTRTPKRRLHKSILIISLHFHNKKLQKALCFVTLVKMLSFQCFLVLWLLLAHNGSGVSVASCTLCFDGSAPLPSFHTTAWYCPQLSSPWTSPTQTAL